VDKKSHKKPKPRKQATKLRKQASPATQSVTARKPSVLKEDSVPVYEVRGVRQPSAGMDATSGRWDRARTQWQLGDWDSLAVADAETLQEEPRRAELAALAACAHLQRGNKTDARRLLTAASRWHCPPDFLARALAASIENNMARYHEVCGHPEKSQRLLAASAGALGGDGRLAAQMRLALTHTKKISADFAGLPPPVGSPDRLQISLGNTEKPADLQEEHLTLEEAIEQAKLEPCPFKPGITSYAQNFEDVMLWRALGHIEKGFYIDIGAQHPVVDSVSKAFYERGWRGIHVEATQAYADLLRQDRPDETVIQAAVSDRHGTLTFYEIPDTGMSTGDAAIAEMHRLKGFAVRQTLVPTITLADILALAGHREIHWLKIDVEGMEKRVLQGLALVQNKPWILVVESTAPNSRVSTHGEFEENVLSAGYEFAYFDGLSRFYVLAELRKLKSKLLIPPNVFDSFLRV